MTTRDRRKQSSSSPSATQPQTCPLAVGDLVLCPTSSPESKLPASSSSAPLPAFAEAEIAAFDQKYQDALAQYTQHSRQTSTASASMVDLTKQHSWSGSGSGSATAPNANDGMPRDADCVASGSGGGCEIPVRAGKAYVHFRNQDHRLDQWVLVSQLRRTAPQRNGSDPRTSNGKMPCMADETRKITRAMKRHYDEEHPSHNADIAMDSRPGLGLGLEIEQSKHPTTVRNISCLILGQYKIHCWYYARFPKHFNGFDTIYSCGTCLEMQTNLKDHAVHVHFCPVRHPPGRLIYNQPPCKANMKQDVKVYEVDAQLSYRFCTRLARIAKLFLEHKSVCYDIIPFNFYVVTLDGEIAGYFSKEKSITRSKYNLACILTFPQHQRKGLGRFLIDLSYQLSRREGKIGSPERPLSDLGQISYRRYWNHAVVTWLRENRLGTQAVALEEIINATGICEADLIATLKFLNLTHIFKSVHFADASSRLLEAAMSKISPPTLPFDKSYLLDELANRTPITNLVGHANGRRAPVRQGGVNGRGNGSNDGNSIDDLDGETKPSGNGYRARKSKKGKQMSSKSKSKSKSKAKAKTSVYSSGSTSRAPVTRFSANKISYIHEFIRDNSPETCLRSGTNNGGLSPAVWRKFAESLNMPVLKVRQKVREMAQRQLDEGAAAGRVKKNHRPKKRVSFVDAPNQNEIDIDRTHDADKNVDNDGDDDDDDDFEFFMDKSNANCTSNSKRTNGTVNGNRTTQTSGPNSIGRQRPNDRDDGHDDNDDDTINNYNEDGLKEHSSPNGNKKPNKILQKTPISRRINFKYTNNSSDRNEIHDVDFRRQIEKEADDNDEENNVQDPAGDVEGKLSDDYRRTGVVDLSSDMDSDDSDQDINDYSTGNRHGLHFEDSDDRSRSRRTGHLPQRRRPVEFVEVEHDQPIVPNPAGGNDIVVID